MKKSVTVETTAGRLSLRLRGGVWYARKQRGKVRHEVALGTGDLEEATQVAEEKMLVLLKGDTPFDLRAENALTLKHYALLFRKTRARAKINKMEYTLDAAHESALVQRAGGRCELTGVRFSLVTHARAFRAPYRASLDRIDSSRGYTPDNVRLVCTAVNWALGDWGVGVFDRLAKSYVARCLLRDAGRTRGLLNDVDSEESTPST